MPPCSRSPGWPSVPSRHSSSGCRRPRCPVRRSSPHRCWRRWCTAGRSPARHSRSCSPPTCSPWRGTARTRAGTCSARSSLPWRSGSRSAPWFFVTVGTATRPLDVTIGVIVLSMVAIQVVRSVRRTAAADADRGADGRVRNRRRLHDVRVEHRRSDHEHVPRATRARQARDDRDVGLVLLRRQRDEGADLPRPRQRGRPAATSSPARAWRTTSRWSRWW